MYNYSMIERALLAYLKSEYGIELSPTQLYKTPEDLGLDSLDAADLILWAEDAFKVKIQPQEFTEIVELRDLVDLINVKTDENQ